MTGRPHVCPRCLRVVDKHRDSTIRIGSVWWWHYGCWRAAESDRVWFTEAASEPEGWIE